MIKFKDGNLVLLLHRFKNKQVELCFFTRKQFVGMHKHNLQDIEVMHLFGSAQYQRKEPNNFIRTYFASTKKDFMRKFTIKNRTPHGAIIFSPTCVLSIQTWLVTKPTSVINDFHLVTTSI